LHDLSAPSDRGLRHPGEAAQSINAKLFRWSKSSIPPSARRPIKARSKRWSSGLASCTGLSILLIDACRSVGIPARLVGTPMWADNRGNHTWVEIWDGGWHFIGAAEPDPKGLDHAWFEHDASQALKDSPTTLFTPPAFRKPASLSRWIGRRTSIGSAPLT
jgi:hypothetical protein